MPGTCRSLLDGIHGLRTVSIRFTLGVHATAEDEAMGDMNEMAAKFEEVLKTGDFGRLAALTQEYATDDFAEEWPQSGERLTKAAAVRMADYAAMTGTTPKFTYKRMLGGAELFVIRAGTIEVYRACAALGMPQATHFAESAAEREWLVEGAGDWTPLAEFLVPPAGETGIRLLAAEGLLTPNLVAAHCVHADAEEIALLAEHSVGVAHCPRSNGYLGCGVAPLDELLEAGVKVAIATDSPASTPSLDLFDELRAAIVAARARSLRPTALSTQAALELATIGGARVLGLADRIGSLVPGKQADLTVISLEGSPFDPVEDPVTAVVLGGSPGRVTATLVGGDERYRKGTTAWPDSTRAAKSARSRMLL